MQVRHAAGSYAVTVGSGALSGLTAIVDALHPGARIAVIADATVATALGSPIEGATLLTFAAGERHKSRDSWSALTDQLLAERFDRHSVIIALGGGVTTDLAGFVAATFLRGIPWIAIPTTTLAMLDAAIGGKTGVDTPAGKNLVGAFHPPTAVVCDPALLATLPLRNFREGLAEAVKHAATLDASYGDWITEHAAAILARDASALETLIHRSVQLKAAVVMADEREGDRRAILNAGHTVAHAIERATNYAIPHGEAVAIGLVLETRVAETMGVAASGTADRIVALLQPLGLPTTVPPEIDRARVQDAMQSDKKNRGGVIHAALIASFGAAAGNGKEWTLPVDLLAFEQLIGGT